MGITLKNRVIVWCALRCSILDLTRTVLVRRGNPGPWLGTNFKGSGCVCALENICGWPVLDRCCGCTVRQSVRPGLRPGGDRVHTFAQPDRVPRLGVGQRDPRDAAHQPEPRLHLGSQHLRTSERIALSCVIADVLFTAGLHEYERVARSPAAGQPAVFDGRQRKLGAVAARATAAIRAESRTACSRAHCQGERSLVRGL